MVSLFQTTRDLFLMTARWLIQESLNFFCSRCIFLTKVKDYNEPALRCFAATLLYSVAVTELLRTPETHCTSKKNLTRTGENKCHTHKQHSQCAQSLNLHKNLFNIYFNGFCFCITIFYLIGILSPM